MTRRGMKQLNVAEAKAKFSELVDAAARGDATIIAKSGAPVAMLVSLDHEKRRMPIKVRHLLIGLVKILRDNHLALVRTFTFHHRDPFD